MRTVQDKLLAGVIDRGRGALEMKLPDGISGDRHAWAAARGAYGREVFTATTSAAGAARNGSSGGILLQAKMLASAKNKQAAWRGRRGGGDGALPELADLTLDAPTVPGALKKLRD